MTSNYSNNQIAGFVIAVSSILSIAIIAHHPTINASEISSQVTEVMAEMKLNNMVHGSLIGLLFLNLSAFTIYSTMRGLQNLLVVLALLAYLMSTIMMAGAALMNGFIFPSFLQNVAQNHQHLLELTPLIKIFSWNVNQTLANTSVIATSCAIALWSLNLIHSNLVQRVIALIGLGVGVTITILMLGGWLALDLTGMTWVVVAQSIWNLGIAYLLMSKKIS